MPNSVISDPMPDVRLDEFIRQIEINLKTAGVDNPPLDARVLVAHELQLDRAQLLSQSDRILTENEQDNVAALIDRRVQHEPVSRILGSREFWSLNFGVNEATLVPRPESETIVEAALSRVRGSGVGSHGDSAQDPLRILDLGTGTGCLLLALMHELPFASGLGIDCAPRAVEQARANAETLGFAARVTFKVNNWMDDIDERFDLVVSNPPYIAQADIPALMPEVRDHDPRLALDGGADGLEVYRLLIPHLPRLLNPNGAAVFEIGEGQSKTVLILFQKSGFKKMKISRDLAGIERCVAASIAA